MSWHGTVRCGHCYDRGHNKRSCPALAKFAEENPDSWAAHRLKESKKKGKVRRCTYCNLRGHNRATCGHLKIAKEAYIKDAKKWRKAWAEWMVADGINVGALLECHPDGWPSKGRGAYMVSGFAWGNLNHETQGGRWISDALKLMHATEPSRVFWSKLPYHEELIKNGNPSVKVLGPVAVTKKALLAEAPAWWKKGYASEDEKLNDVFDKDRTHEDYRENGYKD